jgi:hypothetical protein
MLKAIGKIEINGRRYADGETIDPRDEDAVHARGWAAEVVPEPVALPGKSKPKTLKGLNNG